MISDVVFDPGALDDLFSTPAQRAEREMQRASERRKAHEAEQKKPKIELPKLRSLTQDNVAYIRAEDVGALVEAIASAYRDDRLKPLARRLRDM